MGQKISQNDQKIQKDQLNKKFLILEAQQKQYLKNIYEDQRKSNSQQAFNNQSEDGERVSYGFLCVPRQSTHIQSQNNRKQIVWYDQLVQRLDDIVSNQPDQEYQWARIMVNRLQQVLKSDSSITEIKFQQKCDQDHFFLKLKNIEYEIKMDWLINQKKPRNIKKDNQSNQGSIIIPYERNEIQKDLDRQSKTTFKASMCDKLKGKNDWNIFDKEQMTQSESQQQGQLTEQQMNLEDVLKIRDHNQREINKYIYNNNEIFDEELEQVFGKFDLQMHSFSQSLSHHPSTAQKGSSIKRFQTDSGLMTSSVRNSLQQYQNQSQLFSGNPQSSKLQNIYISQMTKQQQKELVFSQIAFQNKILNSIKFYDKLSEFISQQIVQNKKNWLNKVLRFFVKIFIENWRNRDQCLENLYEDNFASSPKKSNLSNNSKKDNQNNGMNRNSRYFMQDAQISLLQSSQNNLQKEAIKGIQVMKNSIEYNSTEDDITKLYTELSTFIGIFRNLIKSYYDIPFVIEKFDSAKFLIDDVLWNYTVNLVFEFQINSISIFSYQFQMSVQALKYQFEKYKKKFQVLSQKEPQFYKVKDKFCLNHLTNTYIFKQDQKRLKQLEQQQQQQSVSNNQQQPNSNNASNDSQYKGQQNNQNDIPPSIDLSASRNSLKNQMSNLDYQYMKLKEAEERKLEKERLQKSNAQQAALLPILSGVVEQDSQEASEEQRTVADKEKEECRKQDIDQKEQEETKEVYEEPLNNTNANQKNGKQKNGDQIGIQKENYQNVQQFQGEENVKRNKSLLSKQLLQNQDTLDENKIEQLDFNQFQQPFDRCIYYLQKVITEQKPIGKLRLILKAFENIQKCIHRFYDRNRSSEKVTIGPEDLMDITVYILAKSQQYQIIHDIHMVRSFITKNTEFSDKCGYYLQTLEAAFQYIIETEFNRLDENGYSRLSFSNSYKSFCGEQR